MIICSFVFFFFRFLFLSQHLLVWVIWEAKNTVSWFRSLSSAYRVSGGGGDCNGGIVIFYAIKCFCTRTMKRS